MGEERGGEAHRACEAALTSFGVLEHPYWWKHSPAADLTDKQKKELHREVYRLFLFLAVRHIQEGLQTVGKAAAATTGVTKGSASQAALEALGKALAMEQWGLVKPSKAVPVLTVWATKLANFFLSDMVRNRLRNRSPTERFVLPERYDNDADYFFFGFMHKFLGAHKNDLVTEAIRAVGGSGFDFDNPLDTAERLLQEGAVNDPFDYWIWFNLGWVLLEKKDYVAAETAFGRCISLRPEYSRGHEHRALTLVYRALASANPGLRQQFLTQADRDSRTARRLAPYDFSTYWVRGDMDRLLGNPRAAADSYAHALVLIGDLQARASLRGKRLADIAALATDMIARNPNNADGLALQRFHDLAKQEKMDGIRKVVADFEALCRVAPNNLLVRLGKARALERLVALSDFKQSGLEVLENALTAYDDVKNIAVSGSEDEWKHAEADKGRALAG